jgi:hypothetical protein
MADVAKHGKAEHGTSMGRAWDPADRRAAHRLTQARAVKHRDPPTPASLLLAFRVDARP